MFFHDFLSFVKIGNFHEVWIGFFDSFASFNMTVSSGFQRVPKWSKSAKTAKTGFLHFYMVIR